MKFEDFSKTVLKKIIRTYRLHLLEPFKGYTKFEKEQLVNICNKLLIIDNEKIKPKVSEPIYFDFPVDKRKTKKAPAKKTPAKQQPEKINTDNEVTDNEVKEEIKKQQKILDELTAEYEPIEKRRSKKEEELKNEYKKKFGYDDLGKLRRNIENEVFNNTDINKLKKEFKKFDENIKSKSDLINFLYNLF